MAVKVISSTKAQNNFGRLLDDVVQNRARYVVKRRGAPQVILLSLEDFRALLMSDQIEREKMEVLIRELSPAFHLGQTLHKG